MNETRCAMNGCQMVGTHAVCLRVWAPHRRGRPAEGVLSLCVCELHRRGLQCWDVLSDETWQQIVSGFLGLGKIAPDRNLTEIYLLPIDDPKVQEFWRRMEKKPA